MGMAGVTIFFVAFDEITDLVKNKMPTRCNRRFAAAAHKPDT
jgi:hypothetical protein